MRNPLPALLPLVLLFFGCHQEPSPTGLSVLPDDDLAALVIHDSNSDSSLASTGSYFKAITAASSAVLSLGSADGYTGTVLIRWIGLPSDIVSGGTLSAATIRMYASPYWFGTKGAPLTFEAREITSYWSSYSFTSDSLDSKLVTRPVSAGSFSGTMLDSIDIPLDTTLVRSWLMLMSTGGYSNIRGIALQTLPGTGIVQGFESSESERPPMLTIAMKLNGKDTVIAASLAEDTYIMKGPAVQSTSLEVHGGLAHRGRLRFDVSAIPPGSIVNHAALHLTIDRTRCKTHFRTMDSVLVFEVLDSAKDSLATAGVVTRNSGSPDALIAEGYPLLAAVQRWVVSPERNLGVDLVKLAEISDIDLLAFFDRDAAPEKRPRLVVTYTKKP